MRQVTHFLPNGSLTAWRNPGRECCWCGVRRRWRCRFACRAVRPDPVQREQALACWQVLRGHLEDGSPLVRVVSENDVPERTLRRWLAAYRAGGLAGLARRHRSDRGTSAMPAPPPP